MEYLQQKGKYQGQMRKNFSDDEFQEICSLTPWIEDNQEPIRKSIRERVYCILNNITETQFCPECGNVLLFNISHGAYNNFCSKKCRYNSKKLKELIFNSRINSDKKSFETKLAKSEENFKLTGVLEFFDKNGWIRRDFSQMEFQKLCNLTPHVQEPSRKSIRERVYCILNNIIEYPKCIVCNNEVHFLKGGKYSETCSNSCGVKNEKTQSKIKKTKLKIYGSETYVNPNKAKDTCQERYGVDHTSKLVSNRQAAKQTNLERNGSINYNNKEQAFKTSFERYGEINPSYSKEIKDKISISMANNFQARRNEEGTDYSGVVYILHFSQHNAVKIGLTGDFSSRRKGLIKDFGEFSVVDIIETDECFKLESSLHEKFAQYRICLDEGGGRTEFFNEEILNIL